MNLRLSDGRRLHSPPGQGTRPTAARVRQAVLNLLAAELPDSRWLDLCCGSGVMSCEVLLRGVASVVAVEWKAQVAAIARANLDLVRDADQEVWIVRQDVLRWLRRPCLQPFDLIYCDPPYGAGLHAQVCGALRQGGWLRPAGTLLLECSSSNVVTTPQGWQLCKSKVYGSTTLLLLQAEGS